MLYIIPTHRLVYITTHLNIYIDILTMPHTWKHTANKVENPKQELHENTQHQNENVKTCKHTKTQIYVYITHIAGIPIRHIKTELLK